jgi:hypothetical protein
MRYTPGVNVNIFASATYKSFRELNSNLTDDQCTTIRHCAENTVPPTAPNAAAVTENCQHWVVRVLYGLQNQGIVTQEKVNEANGLVQPLG